MGRSSGSPNPKSALRKLSRMASAVGWNVPPSSRCRTENEMRGARVMVSTHTWRKAASAFAGPGLLGGLAGLALLLAGSSAMAAERSIQAIDYTAREGDAVFVTLTLSAPVPEPKVFTLDKPARLSLDLPDTSLALSERLKRINIGKVRSVAVAEAEGRSRVVVFLSEPIAHQVRVSGNKLILELGTGTAVAAATAPA